MLVAMGKAPPVEEYITADDVARMADAACEFGVFIEVNLGAIAACRLCEPATGLYVHALRLLAASGLRALGEVLVAKALARMHVAEGVGAWSSRVVRASQAVG